MSGRASVPESTEVLVVGGGPAGSTVAAFLARNGVGVTLLERERFPRYHIGESILPSCAPILKLSGAWPKVVERGFRPKGGATFLWDEERWDVRFSSFDGQPSAWQVVRSEFDQVLLDHARDLGATVVEGIGVTEVEFDGARPVTARWRDADDGEGRIGFDLVIDASGRAGLLATRYLRDRIPNDVFRNVAVWGYWEGARLPDVGPDGAIFVCSMPDGWTWYIPLHDGTASIGFVTGGERFARERQRTGTVEALYREALDRSAPVRELLEDARMRPGVRVDRDWSYASRSFAGPGHLLVGDAACFLDPLLSTGVHLATFAAMVASASVLSVRRGDVSEDDAFAFYSTAYRRAYDRLMVLVSVFYQRSRHRDELFHRAQALTRRDLDRMDVQAAFDRIVTGLADLEDAGHAYAAVSTYLAGGTTGSPNPLANLTPLHEARQLPSDPGRAVAGLYLVTRPALGLARAEAFTPSAPVG